MRILGVDTYVECKGYTVVGGMKNGRHSEHVGVGVGPREVSEDKCSRVARVCWGD